DAACFLEPLPNGLTAHRSDEPPLLQPQRDVAVGEQPDGPSSTALGRLRAGEGHEVGLGRAVDLGRPPGAPLAGADRLAEPLGAVAVPGAGDGGGTDTERVGGLLISPGWAVVGGVGEQECSGVGDGAGMSGADTGDPVETVALVVGEPNDVLGGHGG